jgi:hypothetical protein
MTFERSSIFVLLRPRRPAAITWLVIAIVVDAVKRQAGRFLAHVSEKILKTVAPAVAYFDATATVVFELLNFRVVAPRLHLRPRAKRDAPSADCVAVRNTGFADAFKFKAPTRLRITAAKIAAAGSCFVSTNAAAFPVYDTDTRGTSVAVGNTENSQAAKYLACDIIEFGHRTAPIGSRSSGGQTLPGLAVAISATRTL